MVVEIWLVYFSCAKADYVFETVIPVRDVTKNQAKAIKDLEKKATG